MQRGVYMLLVEDDGFIINVDITMWVHAKDTINPQNFEKKTDKKST